MENPFDKIVEPDLMPNPGFYCKQYIDTHNWIKEYWPKHLCTKQCDECINKIIEYHNGKITKAIQE
jgi:hypothetical protein